jgi:hypothetical protein
MVQLVALEVEVLTTLLVLPVHLARGTAGGMVTTSPQTKTIEVLVVVVVVRLAGQTEAQELLQA